MYRVTLVTIQRVAVCRRLCSHHVDNIFVTAGTERSRSFQATQVQVFSLRTVRVVTLLTSL